MQFVSHIKYLIQCFDMQEVTLQVTTEDFFKYCFKDMYAFGGWGGWQNVYLLTYFFPIKQGFLKTKANTNT